MNMGTGFAGGEDAVVAVARRGAVARNASRCRYSRGSGCARSASASTPAHDPGDRPDGGSQFERAHRLGPHRADRKMARARRRLQPGRHAGHRRKPGVFERQYASAGISRRYGRAGSRRNDGPVTDGPAHDVHAGWEAIRQRCRRACCASRRRTRRSRWAPSGRCRASRAWRPGDPGTTLDAADIRSRRKGVASEGSRRTGQVRTKIELVIVLQEKHRLGTRWFHWVNFPLLLAMIFSGLLIYWAYDPYRVGLGGITLFHFFPNWFYTVTDRGLTRVGQPGVVQNLALGMGLHFAFAWLFALNGIAYVLYTLPFRRMARAFPRQVFAPGRVSGRVARCRFQGSAASSGSL